MKFICLGHLDESLWTAMTEPERNTFIEECLAYDAELIRGGHFLGGEALQSATQAVTLKYRSGTVAVIDGPYAETKEQLGGILYLEARDLNHAIQLMSKHPGVRAGAFEIRPVDSAFSEMIRQRLAEMGSTEIGTAKTDS